MLECTFQNSPLNYTWTSPDHHQARGIAQSTRITFYKPRTRPETADKRWSDTHIIENRHSRYFTRIEAHYSEPPMSRAEDYPEPRIAYEAEKFQQRVHDFGDTTQKILEENIQWKKVPVENVTVGESQDGRRASEEPSNIVHVDTVEAIVDKNENIKDKVLSRDATKEEVEVNVEEENDSDKTEVYLIRRDISLYLSLLTVGIASHTCILCVYCLYMKSAYHDMGN